MESKSCWERGEGFAECSAPLGRLAGFCVMLQSSLPATSLLLWTTVEACHAMGPSSSIRYSLPKMLFYLSPAGTCVNDCPFSLASWISGHPEENQCHLGA